VSHFVIRKGRLLGRDVIVPVDWIRDIDDRVVHLATVRAALDRLPPYRSDADLAADVAGALEKDPVVRALAIDALDATVRYGVVTLRGHATTPESRARAEEVARDVPGVLRVENRIVSDDEIRAAVGEALARDPRTSGADVRIAADHGVLTLTGEVGRAEVRAAA